MKPIYVLLALASVITNSTISFAEDSIVCKTGDVNLTVVNDSSQTVFDVEIYNKYLDLSWARVRLIGERDFNRVEPGFRTTKMVKDVTLRFSTLTSMGLEVEFTDLNLKDDGDEFEVPTYFVSPAGHREPNERWSCSYSQS